MPSPPIDHDSLADALRALAYPLRLELLETLDEPATLSEIRISPLRGEQGASPARAAAMTTVAAHLDKLVEAGLVVTGQVEAGGKRLTTYTVNPQRVYAITEELRRVSLRHGGRGRGEAETGTIVVPPAPRDAEGPRLVLVHGVYEGKVYPLAGEGPWAIGRRRDATIALDYDPFVSVEHARVERVDDVYRLVDDPESKNGTTLHWRALPKGGRAPLAHGDIVGVGRSLLVFYDS